MHLAGVGKVHTLGVLMSAAGRVLTAVVANAIAMGAKDVGAAVGEVVGTSTTSKVWWKLLCFETGKLSEWYTLKFDLMFLTMALSKDSSKEEPKVAIKMSPIKIIAAMHTIAK